MRTITITFEEFRQEPDDPPGVRIRAESSGEAESTPRENRYADEAVQLIDAALRSLRTGDCVAIARDNDMAVAEQKMNEQLKVRRAARHGQSPN